MPLRSNDVPSCSKYNQTTTRSHAGTLLASEPNIIPNIQISRRSQAGTSTAYEPNIQTSRRSHVPNIPTSRRSHAGTSLASEPNIQTSIRSHAGTTLASEPNIIPNIPNILKETKGFNICTCSKYSKGKKCMMCVRKMKNETDTQRLQGKLSVPAPRKQPLRVAKSKHYLTTNEHMRKCDKKKLEHMSNTISKKSSPKLQLDEDSNIKILKEKSKNIQSNKICQKKFKKIILNTSITGSVNPDYDNLNSSILSDSNEITIKARNLLRETEKLKEKWKINYSETKSISEDISEESTTSGARTDKAVVTESSGSTNTIIYQENANTTETRTETAVITESISTKSKIIPKFIPILLSNSPYEGRELEKRSTAHNTDCQDDIANISNISSTDIMDITYETDITQNNSNISFNSIIINDKQEISQNMATPTGRHMYKSDEKPAASKRRVFLIKKERKAREKRRKRKTKLEKKVDKILDILSKLEIRKETIRGEREGMESEEPSQISTETSTWGTRTDKAVVTESNSPIDDNDNQMEEDEGIIMPKDPKYYAEFIQNDYTPTVILDKMVNTGTQTGDVLPSTALFEFPKSHKIHRIRLRIRKPVCTNPRINPPCTKPIDDESPSTELFKFTKINKIRKKAIIPDNPEEYAEFIRKYTIPTDIEKFITELKEGEQALIPNNPEDYAVLSDVVSITEPNKMVNLIRQTSNIFSYFNPIAGISSKIQIEPDL